jgi:hypothetical protein
VNILKNTALATLLSLSAINANATYDGDADFEITVETADQIIVQINNYTNALVEMSELVDDDIFDVDVVVNIDGAAIVGESSARAITCIISGGAYVSSSSGSDVTTAGDYYQVYITTDGTNAGTSIATVTMSLDDDCAAADGGHDNTLSVSSTEISGSTAGDTYSTGTLTFSVSYDIDTSVANYNSTSS